MIVSPVAVFLMLIAAFLLYVLLLLFSAFLDYPERVFVVWGNDDVGSNQRKTPSFGTDKKQQQDKHT